MKQKPNKDAPISRRYEVTDLRAADIGENNDGQTVEGHAVVYGQTVPIGCWFNEVIERGALDGADLTDVLFFVNHDTDKIPLARSRRNNGNSTMQLSVDQQGLFFKAALDTDKNAEAKSLYSAVGRGDITGMSFMFRVQDEEWQDLDSDMPTRRILKISKVFEISAVNAPAYSETDINARDREALDSAKNALDSARSSTTRNKNALDSARESTEESDSLYLLKTKLRLQEM